MSQTTETILLQVDVVANDARLVELRKELLANQESLAKYNQAAKEGRISLEELAVAEQRLKVDSANLTQEVRTLTAANTAQQRVTDAAKGSIEQLRAQLALETAAYNRLSAAERDNTEAGQKLQASTRAISDELKRLEKAVGDTRRNVGNYKEDVVAALKEQNLFGANIGETAENLKGKLSQGLDIAKKGFGSLKTAVASTGIGLLLLAFASLFQYFKETDEGAENLKAAFAGLGAVFNTVQGVVIGLGKSLFSALSDPKQAAADLVIFLENQVLNRFKALGVLVDAIRTGNLRLLGDGIIQIGTGIENGTAKAEALRQKMGDIAAEAKRAALVAAGLSRAEDELDDSRRAAVVQLERERNQIDKLVLSARDRALSEQQRLANLDKASALESKGLATTTALAREKLRIIQLTNAEAERTGKIQDEQRDAAAQAEAEVERLLGQSATLQQQIANRRAGVLEQVVADRKARAAAALETQRDTVRARQTQLELALLDAQKGSAAELAIKQAQVEAARDLELIAEKQTADQKKLIRAKAAVEIQNLEADFNAKQVENAKKATDSTVKEREREFLEAKKNLEDYLNEKRAAIQRDQAAGIISENQAQKQLNAVNEAGLAAELVNAKDYGQEQGAILKRQSDNEIKEAQRVGKEKRDIKEAERALADAALQAGIAGSDAVIEAFGAESEAGRAALVVKKTLAVAEIAIGVEKQLAANAEAGAKISASAPPVTIPIGIAYTIATDALAIAAGAASAAKVLGFNTGGLVPGSGSTDTVPAMLTPGEVVMNQAASQQFLPVLSYLNTLAGGASFGPSLSTPRTSLADGGLTARNAGGSLFPTAAEIGAAVARNVPTSIGVDTINAANARKQQARAVTSLR